MGKVVGIDLGTTFSAIAYVDEKGQPQIIENRQGNRITPSAVLFGGKKPIVGERAREKSVSDPGNYESFVKRHMGERNYIFTAQNGDTFNAESVSSLILSKLKQDAEYRLGDKIDGAVITVPAYFSDPQRKSTQDAARLAGIPVLDIINEPTAAAIAFGIMKDLKHHQRIMVYDFGGGTFDVSILDIDEDQITVIATDGNHKLGGYNIDIGILEWAKEEAESAGFDIENDLKALQALMLQAEKAKKELSFEDETSITIYIKGEEFSINLDREYFEEHFVNEIVGRTLSIMQNAIDAANLQYSDIDKVILVGGSTRIPKVRSEIERVTGIKPSAEVHPDEAVAIGAAFHAVDVARRKAEGTFDSGVESKSEETLSIDKASLPVLDKNYTFRDVTSHGIGIVAVRDDGSYYNSIIMEKNTPIPKRIIRDDYQTAAEDQDAIFLQVTQGESEDLKYTMILGEAELKLRPRKYFVKIRVIVTCDSDAIIHVHAVDFDKSFDNGNGTPLGEVKINRDKFNMTEEELVAEEKRLHRLNIGD